MGIVQNITPGFSPSRRAVLAGGAGGGGSFNTYSAGGNGGNGQQGIIIITYTPAAASGVVMNYGYVIR